MQLHKIVYETLSRTLLDKFEASLPENVMDVSEQKNTVIENVKLNLSQEEYQKLLQVLSLKTGMSTYIQRKRP